MEPYKIDYHLHCHASFDSEASLSDMVEALLQRGFQEVCFTDHWDIMEKTPSTQIFDFEERDQELEKVIEKYRGKMKIRKGVELGQPWKNKKQTDEFMKISDGKLDYIIGSIHNLYQDDDLGWSDFTTCDLKKIYEDYIDALIDMVKNYEFDMLGHITYPSRYMLENNQIHYDLTPHYEQFEYLFLTAVDHGIGIEINTSGFFRGLMDLMPTEKLIDLYRQCGGELITVGSDAHRPQHAGIGNEKAMEVLKRLGFSYYCSFENRKPIMHKVGD